MRSWVEKLAKVIKKEGRSTWMDEVSFRQYHVKVENWRDSFNMFVKHFNEEEEGWDKCVNIKIYPDEYDLLKRVITDIEKSEEDALIEIFNSFE